MQMKQLIIGKYINNNNVQMLTSTLTLLSDTIKCNIIKCNIIKCNTTKCNTANM